MDSHELEKLRAACLGERDARVAGRINAVYLVEGLGRTYGDAARTLGRCARWARKWVRRYREGGLADLRDRPRPGRPRAVGRATLSRVMEAASRRPVTPDRVRSMIADASGAVCHISTVRRIMRAHGLSPKRARLVHVNRATRRAVAAWWRRTLKRIRRLRRRGFTVLVQDESIFVHDAVAGMKYWSPVGVTVDAPYTGSHHRVVVYGAIAEDGRQAFRTHDRSSAPTFVAYLRELRRRFGRVAVIPGRAPQHTSRAVGEFVRACGGEVALIMLPVGSPYLSVVEEAWRRARRALLNSGHHPTAEGFRSAIGEFFRAARFGLDVHAYLARRAMA